MAGSFLGWPEHPPDQRTSCRSHDIYRPHSLSSALALAHRRAGLEENALPSRVDFTDTQHLPPDLFPSVRQYCLVLKVALVV